MRTVRRYFLKELVVPLAYCISGFVVFWITYDLVDELGGFQSRGLGTWDVVRYYFVKLPEVLVTVMPMALLLALLYAISNHARHNEFTALRAAGVSIWRVAVVYLGVGAVCGGVMFALNEFWVPDIELNLNAILTKGTGPGAMTGMYSGGATGFANYRDNRMWQFAGLDVRSGVISKPKVDCVLADGRHRELLADVAVWTNGYWVFRGVWENIYHSNGLVQTRLFFDEMPMPEFRESPREMLSQLKVGQRMAGRRARRAEVPIVEVVDYLRFGPRLGATERAWLLTQFHGRLAMPFTCVVLVLVALPFGGVTGRHAVFAGVASSVGLCFVYFVLQQVGLALGSAGYVPAWLGAWLPNLVFGGAGLWFTCRSE